MAVAKLNSTVRYMFLNIKILIAQKKRWIQWMFIFSVFVLISCRSTFVLDEISQDDKAKRHGMLILKERIVQYMTEHECFPERLDQLDLSGLPEGVTIDDFDYSIATTTNDAGGIRFRCVMRPKESEKRALISHKGGSQ